MMYRRTKMAPPVTWGQVLSFLSTFAVDQGHFELVELLLHEVERTTRVTPSFEWQPRPADMRQALMAIRLLGLGGQPLDDHQSTFIGQLLQTLQVSTHPFHAALSVLMNNEVMMYVPYNWDRRDDRHVALLPQALGSTAGDIRL
jgi:hypothetical protein